MSDDFEELAITLGKMGEGEWELELEDGETYEASLEEVEVDENRGFSAEGRNEDEELRFELTTGPQPGGPIRLQKRSIYDEEWETAGELADARRLD